MNRDLGPPIAYGRTAEIYAWQEGEILKLFYDWFSLKEIEYEARIAQAVYASGLPVPAAGEIVRVNDRTGMIYQRVAGRSMSETLAQKPWSGGRNARRMAQLHAEMHAAAFQVNIPNQRQRLIDKICNAKALPSHLQSKSLTALETLPAGDRLCHGDFHPGNILVAPQGEVIIDWVDASRGNPLADLARTTIILRGAATCLQIRNSLQAAFTDLFHTAYVRHYFKLHPGGRSEYLRWLPIVAAARLSENIHEQESWLIAQAASIL